MKVALVNICDRNPFKLSKYYDDSLGFLKDHNIDYIDFASDTNDAVSAKNNFYKAIESDAELIWVVRGGTQCLPFLSLINQQRVKSSNKRFLGESDFTHFSTFFLEQSVRCYYGTSLSKAHQLNTKERDNLLRFINTGGINRDSISYNKRVIGGHLLIFSFMQGVHKYDVTDKYIYLEYHHSVIGDSLVLLTYYLDQLLFVLGANNKPKGIIIGKFIMRNINGELIEEQDILNTIKEKLMENNIRNIEMLSEQQVITLS